MTTVAFLAIVALGIAFKIALAPQEAEAIAPLIPILAVGTAVIGGGLLLDGASTEISNILRDAANMLFGFAQQCLLYANAGDMLTRNFDQLFASAVPVLRSIQQAAIIPLANILAVIFLLIGLGKVVSDMNRTEGGVDLWQLVWVFVSYTLVSLTINNSWELMVAAYQLVASVIKLVGATASQFTVEVQTIPDDITNAGVLLMLVIVALITVMLSAAVGFIVQACVIVRSIQIYIYTCAAPAALAFLTSESSRQMATGFLKRYMALLFAGVVMALLFVMMSSIIHGLGSIQGISAGQLTPETLLSWCAEMLYSFVAYVCFAWCMFQAGGWAREMVGV